MSENSMVALQEEKARWIFGTGIYILLHQKLQGGQILMMTFMSVQKMR